MDTPMGHKKICAALHEIKIAKKKIKQKSLDATRLGDIRYQTDLTRIEEKMESQRCSCGPQKICAVLHEIDIVKINK
jgi:hypothetical protein